jgi:hypothetical protein
MELIQPLLAPARGDVDKLAPRRDDENSATTLDQFRLKRIQGVTAFMKLTGIESSDLLG